MPKKLISRVLDTVGDGSGTTDAIGNYAGGSIEDFMIKPASDEVFVLTRMLIQVVDTTGMDADKYGNNITLTNGIHVLVTDGVGSTIMELTDPNNPIIANGDWGAFCYDVDVKTWGTGNNHLLARWTFAKSGEDVYLRGHRGEQLVVRLNDDFSGLIHHHFVVQGYSQLVGI
ncbi:MAG: hypothetical protein ACYSW3_30670 [Planctomycetota bacterium]|jgi:hypothetical protein